ncbi:MAG: S8 family serine peptidase [Microbacteriaceae bacterium]|nr:S8 family serine peptidase [Burkholderiaceae bacterium]
MTKIALIGLLAALTLFFTPCAQAQLRLPSGVSGLPDLGRQLRNDGLLVRRQLDTALAPLNLQGLGDQLLAQHPRELTRNAAGELIVRRQLLALPSRPAARARLLALPEVALIEETTLDGLDISWLLLRAEVGLLARLRALDPDGTYDYQHLYLGSGDVGGSSPTHKTTGLATTASSARVGLIDSGIDGQHPALRHAHVQRFGCGSTAHPAAHGTAVASLLIGDDIGKFRGALPGATLYAADAYCDAADGGSVQAIAQSLAWLARERVGVINISLVGPPNALLQRAVAAAQAKGHLIVAAVGNDGPTAPPLYPAAWPGVVAVTGVDTRRRVLAEAGRGPHVVLAAPGSEMVGAGRGNDYVVLRGTSFAAPLVAGMLAASLPQADVARAAETLSALRSQAVDVGAAGHDDVYGWGLVGEALRNKP